VGGIALSVARCECFPKFTSRKIIIEKGENRASLQHSESRKMQSQAIYGQRYMGNIKRAEQLVLGHLGDSSESAEFGFYLWE
jgi:hypothetical protein